MIFIITSILGLIGSHWNLKLTNPVNLQERTTKVKRSLGDNLHFLNQQYGGTGVDESDLIITDFDKRMDFEEHEKSVNQILINQQIKKLDDLNKKIKEDIKKVNDLWTDYDNKFDYMLRQSVRIGDARRYNSVKWHLNADDKNFEVMNDSFDSTITMKVDNQLLTDDIFVFKKTSLTLKNGTYLAMFPGVNWSGNVHYLPYLRTWWDDNIGVPAHFKNYMGPKFMFDYLMLTLDGKNSFTSGPNLFSIGMYYDSDREDIKKTWIELMDYKKSFISSIFNLEKTFTDFYKEIRISKENFKDKPRFSDLNLEKRVSDLRSEIDSKTNLFSIFFHYFY